MLRSWLASADRQVLAVLRRRSSRRRAWAEGLRETSPCSPFMRSGNPCGGVAHYLGPRKASGAVQSERAKPAHRDVGFPGLRTPRPRGWAASRPFRRLPCVGRFASRRSTARGCDRLQWRVPGAILRRSWSCWRRRHSVSAAFFVTPARASWILVYSACRGRCPPTPWEKPNVWPAEPLQRRFWALSLLLLGSVAIAFSTSARSI
jgi:hypothetical protein